MAKLGSDNFIQIILALVFTSLLIAGGMDAYKTLESKKIAQIGVTESIERWKQSYKALQGVVKEWRTTYTSSKNVPDIRSIVALINIGSMGLTADTDNLVLSSATQMKMSNVDIELSKICLGVNSEYFIVKAATYPELLKGIDALAHRPDLYIGNVSIQGELAMPQAKIGEFCVFLRNE
jgi:hypothetical protein